MKIDIVQDVLIYCRFCPVDFRNQSVIVDFGSQLRDVAVALQIAKAKQLWPGCWGTTEHGQCRNALRLHIISPFSYQTLAIAFRALMSYRTYSRMYTEFPCLTRYRVSMSQ